MSLRFKIRRQLSIRFWRRYWAAQDARDHIEFYRTLAAEWRSRDTTRKDFP